MKWETVTSGIGDKAYALWNNGRKLLTLAFNSSSSFAKIECDGEKRTFTLRYEGFLKNKMVMRNEYGIRIGHVSAENKENLIALNDEKLSYIVTEEEEPKIIIYKDSPESPLAVCSLNIDKDKNILRSLKRSSDYHSLLLTLCWYLNLPVRKQEAPNYL
jgi:hypothetical protein